MKNRTPGLFKKQLLLFMSCFALFPLFTQGAEFVIMNRVISYDVNASDAFWNISVDGSWPANWLSPNNYYNGQIYTRYEVISVATSATFGMQFGIFQWEPNANHHDSCGELCEPVRILQGAGSVAINNSSPSTWWRSYGGVDFSRVVADFQSMSAIIYNGATPAWPVSPASNGGDPTGASWNQRFNWFPVTMRVTVVAVSSGSTFSGWDNYIPNASLQKPTPAYGIDYINETTNIVVPSTDEFSSFPTMYGATSGTGVKMPLVPGDDAYFRTKAGDGLKKSEIQHFDIPCRPATPTFVLDNVNHRTTTAVSSDYEYSGNPDMSGAVSGSGAYVTIAAGTTKYFRIKATGSSFKSKIQSLNESTILPIAHELLLFNDTIDYPNSTDTNGFYYFNYNADMPANWRSPNDYYYGQVYTRYEIISQKTETPIGLQFGLWQLLPPETGELHETMSGISEMNGTGSVVMANSSPSSWWRLDGGFDYTKMNLAWHFGINPWKLDPVYDLYHKQIRQENASVWAERNTYWFPMKVAVTIVAVAYDYTFSGWQNYINVNPGGKKPTPAIGIDYINEETNAAIPSTIEYSLHSNMSGAVNGSGQKLVLTPGEDIYFRTKAGGGLYASDIQHLVVPARPAGPVFSIDYLYERTVENVISDYQYADNITFTNLSTGTGNKIPLVPGKDLYFRKIGSSSTFVSEIFHLINPSRPNPPSVTIDYLNETTNEVFSPAVQYSSNPSYTNPVTCSNAKVSLNPGTDLYFWINYSDTCYASLATLLDVPARPSSPGISIDYSLEKTSVVANTIEWSANSSMTTTTQGTGTPLTVTPGTDLYFRSKAASSSFKSGIQHLVVPARPSTPTITIDYNTESTSSVASTLEWSENASLSPATQGLNVPLNLVPGTDLYLRQKATASAFQSAIQHLIVPQRPSAPGITVDYINENTSAIPASMEWSENASMTSAASGQGNTLAVAPGIDLYFRIKATASTFKSGIQHLVIPERPSVPGYTINYTTEKTNESVVAGDDYATNSTMTGAVSGTNTVLALNPGTDLYFKTRATGSSFISEVQHLDVAERPATPSLSINYAEGNTNEAVSSDIVYSTAADLSNPEQGTGTFLTLTPGEDLYVWQKAGGASFRSGTFHLIVPESNFLGYSGSDTITGSKFTLYALLVNGGSEFSLDDLNITNGTASNLRTGNVFDVYPAAKGLVSVVIPANTITGNSFASNEVIVYCTMGTGFSVNEMNNFSVYPNPSRDGKIYIQTLLDEPYTIDIISAEGKVLSKLEMNAGKNQEIHLDQLKKGLYYLRMVSGNSIGVEKLILE